MPFLNKLGSGGHALSDEFNQGRYWYISFFDNKSISNCQLPLFILSNLQKGTLTLVLDNFFEGFIDIIAGIYKKFVIEFNIPEENIILISENAEIAEEAKRVSEALQLNPIKCKWIRRLEFSVSKQIQQESGASALQYKHYTKKFLNFNRRWRLHRPVFVSFLKARNLLHMGHVSLDSLPWDSVWDNILDSHKTNSRLFEQLKSHETEIKNLPTLVLDFDDTTQIDPTLISTGDTTYQLYLDTYFSLVSETVYYSGSGIMLTEKTFKPIALKHPFIIIGGARSLAALRGLGYKTFSPIINEEYDTELDDIKRMQMILDETERLCYLSDTELSEFLTAAREICEFNYAVLKNKRLFTTDLN